MLPTQRILENRDRVGSNMAASAASEMPEMDLLTRNCMYIDTKMMKCMLLGYGIIVQVEVNVIYGPWGPNAPIEQLKWICSPGTKKYCNRFGGPIRAPDFAPR